MSELSSPAGSWPRSASSSPGARTHRRDRACSCSRAAARRWRSSSGTTGSVAPRPLRRWRRRMAATCPSSAATTSRTCSACTPTATRFPSRAVAPATPRPAARVPLRRRRSRAEGSRYDDAAGERRRRQQPRERTARSVFRHEDDLDPTVLGAPFDRVIVGDRLELAEGRRGEARGLDAVLLQIARDGNRARGRKLPVRRITLGERTDDRLVVRVPLDPDRLVIHGLEDLDDLAEDDEALGLHFGFARVEEDRLDHVDGELALQLRDRDLPLVDLALHLRHQLLVGRADLAHLLLARLLRVGELLREPPVVRLERAHTLAQIGDRLAELAGFHRERALQIGPLARELLVALPGIRELVLEPPILRRQIVVAGFGGLHRLRVLALRDTASGSEWEDGVGHDGHERLGHR